ncbi:MAG TPA: capsule assembly Wzi family protein, partial [Gemmatirosa sp.]
MIDTLPGRARADADQSNAGRRRHSAAVGRSIAVAACTPVLAFAAHTARAQPATARGAAVVRDSTRRDSIAVSSDAANADVLTTIGSPRDERARVAQLFTDSTAGYLLRATSTITRLLPGPTGGYHVTWLAPEVRVTDNSALPTSDNDGALWAGRGTSVLARAGAALRAGAVTVIVAPEFVRASNLPFQSTPSGPTGQFPATGPFASPFFTGVYSADLPIRFGDQPYTLVIPGQSSIFVTYGAVATGLSSENMWWGPGLQNAILLSNAAEGFPHAFVRTAHPLRTKIGDIEAQYFLGGLTRSLYYDPHGRPDDRFLNGAAVTLRLRAEPGLTLGLARMVLSAEHDQGAVVVHALDVLTRYESLGKADTLVEPRGTDQLASAFARWVFPSAHAELYGEFARLELPRTIRDFLIAPMNTGAYTIGGARAFRTPDAGAVRVALELTNLEQTRYFTDRPPPPDYYTGRAAGAGFTSRGQPLGAAIGPGSSSQWIGADYFGARGRLGVYLRRERLQNDALYRQFLANALRHD